MCIPIHICLQLAETKAQIVDSLLDEEKADTQQQSISKLRARRAALEAEKDPRYSGKKVLRKDLKKDGSVEYDPELAKFCILEGSEEEEEEEDADVEEEGADEEEEGSDEDEEGADEEENESVDEEEEEGADEEEKEEEETEEESDEENQSTDRILSQKFKKLKTRKSIESGENESSCEENEVRKLYQDLQNKQKGVT